MNKQVLNELRRKVQYAEDCKYFLQRDIDPEFPIDPEIEERRKDDLYIGGHLYFFKENFCRFSGKNIMNCSLKKHKQEALNYLNSSYPFCFGIEPYNDLVKDLAFYALSIGAKESQLIELKDVLQGEKTQSMQNPEKIIFRGKAEKTTVNINGIRGSAIKAYKSKNLLELLDKTDDKNISRYMEYIMKNGGLENSTKIFEGVCLYTTGRDQLYTAEGNHRIAAYKALKAVKEFVTGKKVKGLEIDATVQRVNILDRNEIER